MATAAICCELLDRFDEALASYDQAIALKPRDAGPYFSRGELLRFQGRADEAVASLDAAVEMDPLHASARLAACMAELPILYASDAEIPVRRQRYLAALERLEAAADDPAVRRSLAEQIGAPPFYLPYQGENDVVPQAIYGKLACRILGETFPPARPPPRPSAGERIRLGIPSGYFRDHTIYKLFLEGWLTEIDRSRFEVIGFHTSALSDHVTTRLAGLCDHFVQGLPSNAAWREAIVDAAPHALLYAEVGIDPVIGWLAAQRLAPLQCLTWGHPETTGMPTLDYYLSSDLMEPPDAEAHYTERLVRLPRLGTHYAPDEARPAAVDHASLGLDPGLPVFWSGQTQPKYLPRYDWIFPRIAQAVGPCRFVFVSTVNHALTRMFEERLGRAFAACGLDAEQVLPDPAEDATGQVRRRGRPRGCGARSTGLVGRQIDAGLPCAEPGDRDVAGAVHARAAHRGDPAPDWLRSDDCRVARRVRGHRRPARARGGVAGAGAAGRGGG